MNCLQLYRVAATATGACAGPLRLHPSNIRGTDKMWGQIRSWRERIKRRRAKREMYSGTKANVWDYLYETLEQSDSNIFISLCSAVAFAVCIWCARIWRWPMPTNLFRLRKPFWTGVCTVFFFVFYFSFVSFETNFVAECMRASAHQND